MWVESAQLFNKLDIAWKLVSFTNFEEVQYVMDLGLLMEKLK